MCSVLTHLSRTGIWAENVSLKTSLRGGLEEARGMCAKSGITGMFQTAVERGAMAAVVQVSALASYP
jgi:hypothetical protein